MLPVPQGALAASPHDESRRIPVCGGTAAHGCRQAVQERAECHRGDLEDVTGSRARVPSAQTSNMARRLLLERNSFWGGVEGFLLTGNLARVFNVPQKAGLLIQRVGKRSPAARLGLRPGTLPAVIDGQPLIVGGDIILEVQGVPIIEEGASYTVIRERLNRLRPGSTITVTVWRNGEEKRLRGTLPSLDR
ncbi:MAG: PDZ domain-containing protein [Nitrospiraceae bacterium]